MNVRRPRNLNDNDVAGVDQLTTAPLNTYTQMSYFLQRIRIAEITRAIVDARAPGAPDVDVADFPQVQALDQLFEQALMDLPPFFQIPRPIRFDELDTVGVQRAMVHLGLHCRRARLHRPFFLQRQGSDPRYAQSHEICLQSAQDIVSISLAIIERSLGIDLGRTATVASLAASGRTHAQRPLSVHRLGPVVNHMFMACTLLAFHAGTSPPSDFNPIQGYGGVRDQLAQAYRALAALGAESDVAAGLVRNLVGLLRRYQVQGIDGSEMLNRLGTANLIVPDQTEARQKNRSALSEETLHPTTENSSLSLDGLWDDFDFGSGDDDYYTHLFADLDYHCRSTA